MRFRRVPVEIFLVWFWRVPVKIPAEAAEGSVRFWTVPVQIPWGVPEGYDGTVQVGSRGFWRRYLVRFRKFPVQLPDRFRRV